MATTASQHAEIQELAEFKCRRGLLVRGSRFEAKGGPFYRLADGRRKRQAEKGPFTFWRYCIAGERRWIEAIGRGGFCVLELGAEHESRVVPGLIVRPYRVTRILGDAQMKTNQKKTAARKPARKPAEVLELREPIRPKAVQGKGVGRRAAAMAKAGEKAEAEAAAEARVKKSRAKVRRQVEKLAAAAGVPGPKDQPKTKRQPAGKAKQARQGASEPASSRKPARATGKASGAKQPARAKQAAENGRKLGILDAAAQILAESGATLRAVEIVKLAGEKGLWESPKGKTPEATLYSAMIREIAGKGRDARFVKVERGLFRANLQEPKQPARKK